MLLYLYDNLYIYNTFEIKYSNHEYIYRTALIIIYHFIYPSVYYHISNLTTYFFEFLNIEFFSLDTNRDQNLWIDLKRIIFEE